MKHSKFMPLVLSLLCGVVTFLVDYLLIPAFLMKGVADWIWIGLMFVIPIVFAVVLLGIVGMVRPSAVFWGLLAQYLIFTFAFEPLSSCLGFHLGQGFETLRYLIYIVCWPFGVTLSQFCALWCRHRLVRASQKEK